MLFEIAIGDAYGAGFEFSSREKITQYNDLTCYVAHDLGYEAGHYTDDTQMSIAVSEVLLSDGEWSADVFAEAFVRCFRRNPRPGYAKGLQELLGRCEDGKQLRELIRPESRRNGAAMRAVPLGLIADKQLVVSTAREQAIVTHHTEEGILSAQVVALMAHFLLHGQARLADLPKLIHGETGFELRSDWHDEVECDALQTLHAVNTALLRHRQMSSLLRECVDFSGDVDSVAAIAMGLASLSPEYESDIPPALIAGLEGGAFGGDFLHGVDTALASKYPVLGAMNRRGRGAS